MLCLSGNVHEISCAENIKSFTMNLCADPIFDLYHDFVFALQSQHGYNLCTVFQEAQTYSLISNRPQEN